MTDVSDRQAKLHQNLEHSFEGATIEITDDSARHAGHAGNTGGSHFNVMIAWPGFAGMSRIARHRAVYAAAGALMDGEIHALAIDARESIPEAQP